MLCPYCGSKVRLKDASEIYNNPRYKGKMWCCSNYPECDAYVGCHKGTTVPLGRVANSRLRSLKREAHKQFDPMWKSELMTRKDAYKWLSQMLHIEMEDCHIGKFDVKQCQKVIHICRKQKNPLINDYRDKISKRGDRFQNN